jgi:hypothetical protein
MNRTVSRRLERLEERAMAVAAATTQPHIICFVDMDKRVTSTLTWENSKQVWTHFDPPRERAEFEHVM